MTPITPTPEALEALLDALRKRWAEPGRDDAPDP